MMVTRASLPFLKLANSEHHHGKGIVTDHLDDPRWVARMLDGWGFSPASASAEATLQSLRALRSHMREALGQLTERGTIGSATLSGLNLFLADARIANHLKSHAAYDFEIVELLIDSGPASHVVRSFARFLASEDPRRLKLCANSECRWAFHDLSRNRSKRWCSSLACGNLAKVRAFRSRARDTQ
jgi:predicted RNA-binding Zn ribbon-like protein